MCKCQMGSINGIQVNGLPVEPITDLVYPAKRSKNGGISSKIENGHLEPNLCLNTLNRGCMLKLLGELVTLLMGLMKPISTFLCNFWGCISENGA